MTKPSSVLILGARGRFGLATARAFAQAGWTVYAQVRPGGTGPATPGVEWISVDLQDTQALAAAAAGATVVVHGLNPAYTHSAWRQQVPALMDGAIRAARALGATLMLPGNVYNFGESMPALLREDTRQAAAGFMGHMRIALEQQMNAAAQDGRMKAVVIRAGDFFGSGAGTWFDQVMVKDLQRGKFTYPGGEGVPIAWAYLPDLARTFVLVAQRRAQLPAFETLHFHGNSLTRGDWAGELEGVARERGWLAAGARLKTSTLPWPLLRVAALFVPTFAALVAMRYLWKTPHALDNRGLVTLIGNEPHTPFAQAVRNALDDLGMRSKAVPAALETARAS
ncbi:MAG: NAD-dependent epimerase/dehydratase family protein [Ramlibacter sp.]